MNLARRVSAGKGEPVARFVALATIEEDHQKYRTLLTLIVSSTYDFARSAQTKKQNGGDGSYVDPVKAQQLLNQRAAEGRELTAVGGSRGLFYVKRAR